ncbi:MAG TPA: GxxExxY protein [Chitinophagales bacterium]|nr:GxxExxY protein [Chitinophagales bacterium]HNE44932.1 GxxExxY protein [Chitinophagales bacterium]HNI53158.1 GxxExxY protein [Chitinophagales bacterium]HNM07285.1 GxxExxY protein [Chitinophagales bacterium]
MTKQILKAFYTVYNALGYGFLEKVYENALKIELEQSGLQVLQQESISVFYDNAKVGYYVADMIVGKYDIVENKACSALNSDHEAQLLNYLKATKIEIGLLLNFGLKPEFKIKIFENKYK